MQVPRFWFIYVEEIARSSSPFRSLRVKQTGIGCLEFFLFMLEETEKRILDTLFGFEPFRAQ